MQAEQICRIVQASLRGIGRDPSEYGSHSLRAGFVTTAGENNISELLISAISGHRDLVSVRRYFRKCDIWRANAAGMVGL